MGRKNGSEFYCYGPFRFFLLSRDSKDDVVEAAASALDLIKNEEVQAIIGPENSMQANFIIDVGNKSHVPILSFSATSPSLTSHRSSYFFRVTTNDSSQVKTISAIVKHFGWRQVVPVYIDTEFGEGIIPYLIDALQDVDVKVPYRCVISPTATDDQIGQELYKLMTMQTRVFVVHTTVGLGSRIFSKAKEIGMISKGYVWIMTDGMTNILHLIDPKVFDSMQGVLGVKTHVPQSKLLEYFKSRWMRKFRVDNPNIDNPELDVFGLWAYDAIWALAFTIEKVYTLNIIGYNRTVTTSNNSTDLNKIGVNLSGSKLRDALSNIKFKGLAGEFNLINGQLQSSTFQVINVIDNGRRLVGYWTPQTGLTKRLLNSTKEKLKPILWAGDSTSAPKGWQIPTNGKKLRIGVPVKDGFSEFVKVSYDANRNTTDVIGYCIDVFVAVIEALPYAVSYEFIPFWNASRKPAGSYDDLTYQVYIGNLDAVVGDTTIVANRSTYIDYTLPFTESGVSMVVPVKDNARENGWIFLRPLTWKLWMTMFIFFVYIGLVVWILEHRVNEDFQGSAIDQICTSLWYSFSTMVFAHRESTTNNWAKFVVIVWLFAVLILTQSYTANLASFLTVQQLQPTITDVNQLVKNGERVGYQRGSFVLGILKSLNFDESKLVTYDSPEELDLLFSKGSVKNGISAAFDENPYIKLFQAKYCNKYTMQEPTYKADGFGFVFPMGSPLVPEISRAILNVTEGEKMRQIEKAWFKKDTISACSVSSDTQFSSTSLNIESFWGLFLVSGLVALLASTVYIGTFLYKERGTLRSNLPILNKISTIFRKFLEKERRQVELIRRNTH